MPDQRLEDPTDSSTHRTTQLVRERVQRMGPEQRAQHNARLSEYQALWQACARVSARQDYKRATVGLRKTMLLNATQALLGRRRDQGKIMCGTKETLMVEKHLKREAQARSAKRTAEFEAPIRRPQRQAAALKNDDANTEQVPLPATPTDLPAPEPAAPEEAADTQPQDEGPSPPQCRHGELAADRTLIDTLSATVRGLQQDVAALRADNAFLAAYTNDQLAAVTEQAYQNRELIRSWHGYRMERCNGADVPGWETPSSQFDDAVGFHDYHVGFEYPDYPDNPDYRDEPSYEQDNEQDDEQGHGH